MMTEKRRKRYSQHRAVRDWGHRRNTEYGVVMPEKRKGYSGEGIIRQRRAIAALVREVGNEYWGWAIQKTEEEWDATEDPSTD